MSPRVSIIMGVFNGEKRIQKSINSIITQSFKDWEFIICDDCSTDNTYEKLLSISKQDSRVKIIRNKKNMSLAFTLNECLKEAQGEYIARQDDDDLSEENRLEKQVLFLDSHPEIDLVSTWAKVINNNQETWSYICHSAKPTINDLIRGSCLVHPAVMIRKKTMCALNGYNASKKALRVEDYELWFRFFEKGFKCANIPEFLIRYRVDISDLKKRKFKHRITEANIKIQGFRKNGVPKIKWFWALKPIVVGLIPNKLIHLLKSKLDSNPLN